MVSVTHWFMEGGIWMYVILLLAVVGLPADLVALVLAIAGRFAGRAVRVLSQVGAVMALGLSASPGLFGLVGWWVGCGAVEAAVRMADPSMQQELMDLGYAEARVPLIFGGGVSAVLLVLALVTCVVAFAPRREVLADE